MLMTIVKCPSCSQKLRVPEDRGSILVSCGSCSLKWMYSPDTPPPTPETSSGAGLKSWLGKAARSITGGVATVAITHLEESAGEYPAIIRVRVDVADEPVAMKSVQLQIVCEETITLPSGLVRLKLGLGDKTNDELPSFRVDNGQFDHREKTHNSTLELNGPAELEAKSTQTFSGPIVLPKTALPTFVGRHIANQWRVRAVLKTSSGLVNPKSDWILLPVS